MAQTASFEPLALAHGAVLLHEGACCLEMLGRALLRRGRLELIEERVEALARRLRGPGLEVRERPFEAVPQRLPAVLLDAPGRGGGGFRVASGVALGEVGRQRMHGRYER